MARPKAARRSQHQHRNSNADKGADKVPALSIAAEELNSSQLCPLRHKRPAKFANGSAHRRFGSGSILSPSITPSHRHTIAPSQHPTITPSHHATVTSAGNSMVGRSYDVMLESGPARACSSCLLAEKASDDAQQLERAVGLGHVVVAPGCPGLLLVALHRKRADRDDRRGR